MGGSTARSAMWDAGKPDTCGYASVKERDEAIVRMSLDDGKTIKSISMETGLQERNVSRIINKEKKKRGIPLQRIHDAR